MGLSGKAIQVIEQRGLDPEVLAAYGVESFVKKNTECLSIPFYLNGKIVNHKYKSLEPLSDGTKLNWQDEGAPKIFLNVDALSDASLAGRPLIVCEGEWDMFALMGAGFQRVVSVPDGAPDNPIAPDHDGPKFDYVSHALPFLKGVRRIILATDGDPQGGYLRDALADRLGRARCLGVCYPEGLKDANDILQVGGREGIERLIYGARWLDVSGVYLTSTLPETPDPRIWTLGVEVLDDYLRVRSGDLWAVTGIPSFGKTSLVRDFAARLAMRHGVRTAVLSLENKPRQDWVPALYRWYTNKPPSTVNAAEAEAARVFVEEHFRWIVPNLDDRVTVDWALEKARSTVIRDGASILIADPYNMLDHDRPWDVNETEYVNETLKQFARFGAAYDCAVWLVTHPTKQVPAPNGTFKMPTLYDIMGSSNWFNRVDIGLVVHRSKGASYLKIGKAKYAQKDSDPNWNGQRGSLKMHFNVLSGRYQVQEVCGSQPGGGAPGPRTGMLSFDP